MEKPSPTFMYFFQCGICIISVSDPPDKSKQMNV